MVLPTNFGKIFLAIKNVTVIPSAPPIDAADHGR